MPKETPWLDLKYGLVVGAIVLALVGALRLPTMLAIGSVGFCKKAFGELAGGRMGVVRMLDWETLTAMGIDVGKTYRNLAGERNRASYQRQFIEAFARSFRQSGGRPEAFVRWRIVGEEGDRTIVAADYPAKQRTLLFLVPLEGPRRVMEIRWAS